MGVGSSGAGARDLRCCACSSAVETVPLLTNRDDDIDDTTQVASVIQYSCPMFFCKESEGVVNVDVVRFGDASQKASVEYYSQDSSAKAGKKYVAQSGVLTFLPGETLRVIEIPLIEDDAWDATLEFSMQLKRARGAQLGLYLHAARVMIIDDDSFPTNKYVDNFSSPEEEEKIPGVGIFIEFCKMSTHSPQIFWGTWKTLLLDQVKNMYFFLTLYLQMYLVDVVLSPGAGEESEGEGEEVERGGERRLLLHFIHSAARRLAEAAEHEPEEEEGSLVSEVLLVPGNRTYTAIVVGLIYVTPFVLLHCIDIKKLAFGVAGAMRARLQTNLLRKFLNYRESHRAKISMGDFQMIMVRDVTEVVDFGYMKIFPTIAIIGKLCFAMVFILSENKMAVVPLALYPVVMGIFLACRGSITIETNEEMARQQDHTVQVVNEATGSYRMIADFLLRSSIVDTYESQVIEFNEREIASAQVSANNMYLPPWLTTLLVGGYMMTAPLQVETFGGPLTLGAFLATINIFKEMGAELTEIYHEIMEIQKSIGPLCKLCHFMNLETDVESRMNINRSRRELGNKRRKQARQDSKASTSTTDGGETVFAVDTVPIEVNHLTFSFPGGGPFLKDISATFDQGMMYAIVGPSHEGKSVFLKLLGQVLLPDPNDSGYIFVPPHMRVLHLSQETFVMSMSLVKNIIFNTDLAKVGGIPRITRICKLLNFSDYILSELKEETGGNSHESDAQQEWMSKLTHTDFARLNLARAFVMNPELLVLHKPHLSFDDWEKRVIFELLREHVDRKGLELSDENQNRRRRTVFFTSASRLHAKGLEHADGIYEVSAANGLRNITKEVNLASPLNPPSELAETPLVAETPFFNNTAKCFVPMKFT